MVVESGYSWGAALERYPPVAAGELPASLGLVADYLRPLSSMYREDWTEFMALAFWSGFWSQVRYENVAPNLWLLGVGLQSSGKTTTSDELYRVFRRTVELTGQPVAYHTGGSVELLVRALSGNREPVLAYYPDFAGFLESLPRTSGSREILRNFYEGRDVVQRAKGGGYDVVDPYVALVAVTTPAEIGKSTGDDDWGDGFLGHFLCCAPDDVDDSPRDYPTEAKRLALASVLCDRIEALRGVGRVVPDGEATLALAEYERSKGVGTGRIRNLDLEWRKDEGTAFRLVTMVKKVATLLALAGEALPQGDTLATTASDVSLAVRIVERSNAYAVRMAGYVGGQRGKDITERVSDFLRRKQGWHRGREIMAGLRVTAADLSPVLDEFVASGQVERTQDGRTVAYRWRNQ